jgi:hypothetical protein
MLGGRGAHREPPSAAGCPMPQVEMLGIPPKVQIKCSFVWEDSAREESCSSDSTTHIFRMRYLQCCMPLLFIHC